MSGIAGFCDFNKKSTKEVLKNMTDVLHHRDPDDSGYSIIATQHVSIGLEHRKLRGIEGGVKEEYSLERIVKQWEEIIEKVVI